jgi:hypothetical protein
MSDELSVHKASAFHGNETEYYFPWELRFQSYVREKCFLTAMNPNGPDLVLPVDSSASPVNGF